MFRRSELTCSFCGKSDREVAKLVAGPRVFICDGCVAIAARLMQGNGDNQPQPSTPQPGLLRKLVKRIRGARRRTVERRSSRLGLAP
jgi:hypothetical protein